MGLGGIIGAIIALIVGGVVASVTLFGLVDSQVNSPASVTSNVNSPSIDYGTTQ